MKKSYSILRESVEFSILYRPKIKDRMFCAECGFPVRWVLPEEAMALRRTSIRSIFSEIELDLLHHIETDDGFLLICAESLNQEVITLGEIGNEIEKHLIAA